MSLDNDPVSAVRALLLSARPYVHHAHYPERSVDRSVRAEWPERTLHTYRLVSTAILDVARDLNVRSPANKLPDEILSRIASFLSLRQRLHALRVCRKWHNLLLRHTKLWSSLSIQLHRHRVQWLPTLSMLLDRSGSHPLSLHLRCLPDPSPQSAAQQQEQLFALQRALLLVQKHMPRMRSLFLTAHGVSMWLPLLAQRAPLLEEFCILDTGAGGPPLPADLFDGFAPRLRRLQVDNVDLPDQDTPALRRVTDLVLHDSLSQRDMLFISAHMPRLRRATLLGSFVHKFATRAPQEVALRVLQHDTAHRAIYAFPAATTLCISCAGVSDQSLTDSAFHKILDYQVSAVVRTAELRWTKVRGSVPELGSGKTGEVRLSLLLNDSPALVDVELAALLATLEAADIAPIMREVCRLTIPIELCAVFASVEMPQLTELTILVCNQKSQPINKPSLPPQLPGGTGLHTLRLACVDYRNPNRQLESQCALPAAWLADCLNADSGMQPQRVILNGVDLIGNELDTLLPNGPIVEQRHWCVTHTPDVKEWLRQEMDTIIL